MNSTETLPVNGVSRRNMLQMLGLSILVPSVSRAVDGITSRSSSNLPLDSNNGTMAESSDRPKVHKARPEEPYDNEPAQEEVSHAGKMTLIVGALLGLDKETRQHICASMNDFFEKYLINNESEDTYTDTARGSVKLVGYNTLLAIAFSYLSFREGNAGYREAVKYENEHGFQRSFLSEIWDASVVAPIEEELTYRLLIPGILAFFNSNPDFAQYYSSLIFGFVHNITFRGFDVSTIPATQILAGFFFFYLKQTRGITHSMASHATYNGTITSLYHLGSSLMDRP